MFAACSRKQNIFSGKNIHVFDLVTQVKNCKLFDWCISELHKSTTVPY